MITHCVTLEPLFSELWLNWIEDERRLTDLSTTPEGRAALVSLFDRAVQDYLCKYMK